MDYEFIARRLQITYRFLNGVKDPIEVYCYKEGYAQAKLDMQRKLLECRYKKLEVLDLYNLIDDLKIWEDV